MKHSVSFLAIALALLILFARGPAKDTEERTAPAEQKRVVHSFLPSPPVSLAESSSPTGDGDIRVLHVIDGDTVILEDGRRVRYIGVDTPERDDQNRSLAFGNATERNRQLVEGQDVRLEGDVQDVDRYGRLLRYVWKGERMINVMLLEEGYARLLTIPPNVKYVDVFRAAAERGGERREEIWKPVDGAVAGQETTLGGNCGSSTSIKGNISHTGERIYHVPGGRFYDVTHPERCFASITEAEVAGFRKSKR